MAMGHLEVVATTVLLDTAAVILAKAITRMAQEAAHLDMGHLLAMGHLLVMGLPLAMVHRLVTEEGTVAMGKAKDMVMARVPRPAMIPTARAVVMDTHHLATIPTQRVALQAIHRLAIQVIHHHLVIKAIHLLAIHHLAIHHLVMALAVIQRQAMERTHLLLMAIRMVRHPAMTNLAMGKVVHLAMI